MAAILLSGGVTPAKEIGSVYQRVKASVVVIATEQREVAGVGEVGLVSTGGLGSGILISDDGKILTAAHVVQTAEKILVQFLSGEMIAARVIASEPAADVALLQLERRPAVAQVASLGDSDRVDVGDQVFVVGAPLGISHSVTVGHISGRRIDAEVFGGMVATEMFQTDAAINEGNSGGPMFNLKGEVIGVVSYILSHGGGFEGLGFVITSNMARELLLEQRSMWSGLQGFMLEGELAQMLNLPQAAGLLVQQVASDSPAGNIGLKGGTVRATIADLELVLGGDVILETQGISLADPDSAARIKDKLHDLKPGDPLLLKVLRGGKVIEMEHHLSKESVPPDLSDP
jgi:serine protease Do